MLRPFSVLSPLLLSATLLAIAGCNSGASDQPVIELARVRTAAAVAGPAAPSIRTNGLLANEDEIRLSFKVGGVIRRLSVTEGDQVRQCAQPVLARLAGGRHDLNDVASNPLVHVNLCGKMRCLGQLGEDHAI